jgi:hypothetical protein
MKTPGLLETAGLPHHEVTTTRRDFLARAGGGFGAVALAQMLSESNAVGAPTDASVLQSPTAAKKVNFAAKAKSVIFLFMEGGPSHLDLFDRKPLLNKLAGKPVPDSFGKVITAMGEAGAPILESKRRWSRHGQSGLEISDWLPHIATHADDLAVIRSCWGNGINHAGGVCLMNTGSPLAGRPSLGSWVTYGLGTENYNLPAFVVMTDTKSSPVNGPRNWGTAFMPALYQGVQFNSGSTPISNLNNPKGISNRRQNNKLDFLNQLNREHAGLRREQSELEARIRSYELAFRMQAEAPEAVDISSETEATKKLYGLDDKMCAPFGRNCLLARRLVERGVRFVQLYHGTGSKWDSHSKMEVNHTRLCRESDLPVAALLTDLKQRGLLDETLVVWGGEFGRTPMSEKGDGRDHNPSGFTMWMAGGGVKGGQTIGATDELGLHAVEDKLHVHDLHATILRIMGVDHTKLVYTHKGRPERVDLNEGEANLRVLGRS